ncbi:putative pyridine nucleotide-disulfide oxidoreductase [Cylindrobasidium torrendii FP15055 ss-10]|uniref:Putative pyridine nucleotide-disulfide oxidoreductase n=1 Tax=Cylindrobasidium torrendii FP15055 ss-10 TaxID=1314674 RepID=A0A0D7BAT5_9AGAR|nr:putative pyridine nucleotide-disulfide oxidoreductase [Cylindrobasidium torrendii FP15055 ss-10]
MSTKAIAPVFDALIIGGGPGGLSVALGMARQLHTAVVFDSKSYRNAHTPHMHNVVTWDHRAPQEFRDAARKNILERYKTIIFEDVKVERVSRAGGEGAFEAVDANGKTWRGRTLVLASGVEDKGASIQGFDECWIGGGIFHCLFCDGYECRDAPSSGVLAIDHLTAPRVVLHAARNAAQITPKKVTIYTNGNTALADELNVILSASGRPDAPFVVDARVISRLAKSASASGGDVTLHFDDGTPSVTEGFLAFHPATELKSPFAKDLGLELTPAGDIKVAAMPVGRTSDPDVFAVGDVTTPMRAVTNAMWQGAAVAGMVTAQIQAQKWGHPMLFGAE